LTLPALTSDQVREVNRLMVEKYGIQPLQMMEMAGLNLALLARQLLSTEDEEDALLDRPVVVLAGRGSSGGGGLAGHKGLRSIRDHLRATSIVRIRIGIGRPPSAEAGAGYVLSRPASADRDALAAAAGRAADAAEVIAVGGVEQAMNTFNVR